MVIVILFHLVVYLLLRFLAISSKDIDVGLPDVGPSGLGLDEVVLGGVQVGTCLGMTTRSMARGVDNDGIIDPEDSVSNLGSRAAFLNRGSADDH